MGSCCSALNHKTVPRFLAISLGMLVLLPCAGACESPVSGGVGGQRTQEGTELVAGAGQSGDQLG